MLGVAGVSPLKVHATTWVAALTLAAVCVAGALYVGDKAARYLPDTIAITSWKPPSAARDAGIAAEQSQTSNLEKKAARETVHRLEARMTPELATPGAWKPIDPSRSDAEQRGAEGDASRQAAATPAPQDDGDGAAAQTGRASWYDLDTPTANGELLDDEELTAAHRSAPFGTRLRVVNLENGREVVVRVNDRGPFAKDRIIDLSKAAADQLGMIADGVAKVQVSPVVEQVAGN